MRSEERQGEYPIVKEWEGRQLTFYFLVTYGTVPYRDYCFLISVANIAVK